MNQTMWIRVKKDGFIYPYDDILAKNPDCEVVTEQVAFPHKFITPEVKQAIEKVSKTRSRRAPLALATEVPGWAHSSMTWALKAWGNVRRCRDMKPSRKWLEMVSTKK